MDYLLVSPVHNEESHLPALAESIIHQTQLPRMWLIVDDGSTDRTPEIIKNLCSRYSWIISRRLETGETGLGKHFGEIMKFGFDEARGAAREEKIRYQLIGKADADIVVPPTCLQELAQEFSKNTSLGIASPALIIQDRSLRGPLKKFQWDVAFEDHPTDGVRLIRKECYDSIGGYLAVRASETVAEAKARMRGWQLRRFSHITAYLHRISHENTSIWKRWAMGGAEAHYLGYPFVLATGHFFCEAIFGRPWYRSWAYLWGYIHSAMRREPKIPDKEIQLYFKKRRLWEILAQMPRLIRNTFLRVPR